MEFICEDAGGSRWCYEPIDDSYRRVYPDGSGTRILGRFLPDPEEAWANKISRAQSAGHKPDIKALKPTDAVYLLWNHRKNRLREMESVVL